MLVLSRKVGESFFVGEDVEVFILESQGDKIKIGINAPSHVKLARSELRETQKANLAAAQVDSGLALESLKKIYLYQK